jgi:transcriptional regulator with XRE-family HTH domain
MTHICEEIRYSIANQVRDLRLRRHETQHEFGESVGKQQSIISQLENGRRSMPTIQTLIDIADALGLTVAIRFEERTQ